MQFSNSETRNYLPSFTKQTSLLDSEHILEYPVPVHISMNLCAHVDACFVHIVQSALW